MERAWKLELWSLSSDVYACRTRTRLMRRTIKPVCCLISIIPSPNPNSFSILILPYFFFLLYSLFFLTIYYFLLPFFIFYLRFFSSSHLLFHYCICLCFFLLYLSFSLLIYGFFFFSFSCILTLVLEFYLGITLVS